MTQHGHDHHHQGHGQGQAPDHHPQKPPKKGVHQDWRVWTIVILMIVGMVIYMATLDESMLPWGKPGPKAPADAAP